MLRAILSAAALWGLVLAGSAQAAPKPPQAIWDSTATTLDHAANEGLRDPDEPTRGPDAWGTPNPKMFTRMNVNGDGIDDWRVNFEHAPNPSLWCGTGGCRNEIWVSEPGNSWRRVMSTLAREVKLIPRGGGARLDLDFHGTVCGGYGVQACPRGYLWDERAGFFVETAAPGARTWLSGGPVTLEDPNLDTDAPPPIHSALERLQMECGVYNGAFDPQGNVTRIPDLDGDGVRDWVIGSVYAICEYDDANSDNVQLPLTVSVYVTNGKPDEPVLALEGKGIRYGIDLGPSPAAFYFIEEEDACEYEKPCGRRLTFDKATGYLTD